MKNLLNRKTFSCSAIIVLIFIATLLVCQFYNNTVAYSSDIYDVILFWGQSNMVGYCGLKQNERVKDIRFDFTNLNDVDEYSKISGIDKRILSGNLQMNWVQINHKPNTAYEYIYSSDNLVQITDNTKVLGEKLKYNVISKKLEVPSDKSFSIQKSYGTNMIPQFCKTYYEKTGHKVIAVLAANGGEKIANFLPTTDREYGDTKRQMIYESMVEKFRATIDYMVRNNLKIGNRIWVAFQGEADVRRTSTEEYKHLYQKVHDNLKRDLKITKGAIVETSHAIGTDLYLQVNNINKAQKQLALENKDIIIGSSYAYDRYIPNEKTYNSVSYYNKIFTDNNGNKLPYAQAFKIASCSVCYPDNRIHLTSAALSQIGKETAERLADSSK